MARARLGMAFQDLRGELNGQVLTKTRFGLVAKRRPQYQYPKNPEVQKGVDRLKSATAVWNTMTAQQAAAWREYAETVNKRDEVTGTEYSPTAKNAFIGLATKFLQVTPTGTVPVSPPMSDFVGEDWKLSVAPMLAGDSPSLLQKDEAVMGGGVTFTAPLPNTTGNTTELVMQKLLNVRRSPTNFYKSVTFVTFTAIEPTFDLLLEPGVYAFGYRFVRTSTGQATQIRPLGVYEVG